MIPAGPRGGTARIVTAAAAAFLFLLPGCGAKKDAASLPANVAAVNSVTPRGDLAPDFSWKAADGAEVSFDARRGKVTLVNFWATWCGPCKAELPDLVELHRAYGDRGFSVVGVATDRTPNAPDLVAEFVTKYRIPYQVLLSTQEIEDAFRNVRMMPTSFLVDREGRIVQTLVGIRTKAQLEELILPLL